MQVYCLDCVLRDEESTIRGRGMKSDDRSRPSFSFVDSLSAACFRLVFDFSPLLPLSSLRFRLVNTLDPQLGCAVIEPSGRPDDHLERASRQKNVENFLAACRKLGVAESVLFSPHDLLASTPEHRKIR